MIVCVMILFLLSRCVLWSKFNFKQVMSLPVKRERERYWGYFYFIKSKKKKKKICFSIVFLYIFNACWEFRLILLFFLSCFLSFISFFLLYIYFNIKSKEWKQIYGSYWPCWCSHLMFIMISILYKKEHEKEEKKWKEKLRRWKFIHFDPKVLNN